MAPKKKNAFVLFAQQYAKENCKVGYKMSLKEAVEVAGPLWSKMSDKEKAKYREQAKETSAQKYTSQGIPIDYIKKMEDEQRAYEHNMIENIRTTIQNMATAHSLQYLDICIVHVNTFCQVVSNKRHYPAEIAVSKFNLRDGVWDVYHILCNPGPIPLGYAATVQTRADESHQLMPPTGPSNLQKIFFDLVSFIDDRRNGSKIPPLYAMPNNYQIAKEVLTSMCQDFGYDDSLSLETYSLAHLFYQLRNAVAERTIFPSTTVPLMEFERDVYEYAPQISCAVHEEIGVQNHCSKSIVTRMAYIICDHCCRDLNIELIAGKHVPYSARIVSSRASSEIPDRHKYRSSKRSLYDSDTSESVRFSDDGRSSVHSGVSEVTSKVARMRLCYAEDMDADMSSSVESGPSSLDFLSCSSDYNTFINGHVKVFGAGLNASQRSGTPFLTRLSQLTVDDYSSDDSSLGGFSLARSRRSKKGRGFGIVRK